MLDILLKLIMLCGILFFGVVGLCLAFYIVIIAIALIGCIIVDFLELCRSIGEWATEKFL